MLVGVRNVATGRNTGILDAEDQCFSGACVKRVDPFSALWAEPLHTIRRTLFHLTSFAKGLDRRAVTTRNHQFMTVLDVHEEQLR
eukprot:6479671-Amphidinium_carterae.2